VRQEELGQGSDGDGVGGVQEEWRVR
jgi:hypothetical protein